MSKIIFTTLCALTLVGCGDSKQQKLEACMEKAGGTFYAVRDALAEKMGCGTATKPAASNAWAECSIYEADLKKERLEAEDRCVKLYK